MNNSPDKTYHSAIIGLLVMAELMAGFLVISLPTLPKLATTIFEKSSQATSRFGSRSSYGDAGKATKLDEKTKTETKGSDESSVRATISGVGASPRLSLDRSSFGDDPFADVLAAVPASRQAENWREVNSAGPGYMDMDLEFQTKPSYLYPEP